jgi:pSer/pThr/pTyr-binding forkhead associated (FHA) protein
LADVTVLEGDGTPRGTKFSLKKSRQKIGRREDMDIRLNDETVSREHASIWWEDGSFFIQDEASTASTLVNGQRITRQSLNDNDEIQLGKSKLIFRLIAK